MYAHRSMREHLFAGCSGSQPPIGAPGAMVHQRRAWGEVIRRHNAATAAMLIILVLCLQRTTLATNKYPVPFSDKPDWHGFIVNPPAGFAAVLRARVMAHALVLVTLNSSAKIDQHKAATLAYQNLFSNASRLPAGPLYVVVTVYGPRNFIGTHPEFAYVFRRDTAPNGWKARLVSEPEVTAIQCALGHEILVGHGAC
jgi:hypothetical protein